MKPMFDTLESRALPGLYWSTLQFVEKDFYDFGEFDQMNTWTWDESAQSSPSEQIQEQVMNDPTLFTEHIQPDEPTLQTTDAVFSEPIQSPIEPAIVEALVSLRDRFSYRR